MNMDKFHQDPRDKRCRASGEVNLSPMLYLILVKSSVLYSLCARSFFFLAQNIRIHVTTLSEPVCVSEQTPRSFLVSAAILSHIV